MISFRQWETAPNFELEILLQGGHRHSFTGNFTLHGRLKRQSISRETASVVLHKKYERIRKRLWNILDSCVDDGDMTITEVSGLHFSI